MENDDIFKNSPMVENNDDSNVLLAGLLAEFRQLRQEVEDLKRVHSSERNFVETPQSEIGEINELVKGALVSLLGGIGELGKLGGLGQLGQLGNLGRLGGLGNLGNLPHFEQPPNSTLAAPSDLIAYYYYPNPSWDEDYGR